MCNYISLYVHKTQHVTIIVGVYEVRVKILFNVIVHKRVQKLAQQRDVQARFRFVPPCGCCVDLHKYDNRKGTTTGVVTGDSLNKTLEVRPCDSLIRLDRLCRNLIASIERVLSVGVTLRMPVHVPMARCDEHQQIIIQREFPRTMETRLRKRNLESEKASTPNE